MPISSAGSSGLDPDRQQARATWDDALAAELTLQPVTRRYHGDLLAGWALLTAMITVPSYWSTMPSRYGRCGTRATEGFP
jgi:hypothetical protein